MITFQPHKKGRLAFKPTDMDRQRIEAMHSFGVSQETIAAVFKTSVVTLRKHCREELTRGAAEANFQVGRTLYEMATSGRHLGATIFWAKTRLRYKTTDPAATEFPTPTVVNNDGGSLYRE